MKIAILSDTHDDTATTLRALERIDEYQPDLILHCGDITTARIVELFAGHPVRFVYGNMDISRAGLQAAARANGLPEPQQSLSLTLDGVPITVIHGHEPHIVRHLLTTGSYRYLFHGHTHRRTDQLVGSTRIINPGALGGRQPESRSICLLELAEDRAHDRVEFVEFEDQELL